MKAQVLSLRKPLASILHTLLVVGAFLVFWPLAWADFSDVAYTDQSYVAINTLVDEGVVKGLTKTTFGPDQTLNRAQAVTLMLRYGGYDVSEDSIQTSSFSDVDPKFWYAAPVEQAVDLNIVKGNPDGTFAPAREVKSAEFLIMLTRTDDVDLSGLEETDGEWYTAVMNYAQESGVYLNDDPAAVLTREDAADILYLSLLLREKKDNDFLSAQAQKHLSHIESSVAANQLNTALYHAELGVGLTAQLQDNLPNSSAVAAKYNIAQSYLAWVESIVAALQDDNELALAGINQTLQFATDAYFEDNSTQPLGAHLKDIACEVYGQLPEPKGEMPEDCAARLAQ